MAKKKHYTCKQGAAVKLHGYCSAKVLAVIQDGHFGVSALVRITAREEIGPHGYRPGEEVSVRVCHAVPRDLVRIQRGTHGRIVWSRFHYELTPIKPETRSLSKARGVWHVLGADGRTREVWREGKHWACSLGKARTLRALAVKVSTRTHNLLRDGRYTLEKEHCGQLKPWRVARFLGGYIGSAPTISGAFKIAQQHYSRITT